MIGSNRPRCSLQRLCGCNPSVGSIGLSRNVSRCAIGITTRVPSAAASDELNMNDENAVHRFIAKDTRPRRVRPAVY